MQTTILRARARTHIHAHTHTNTHTFLHPHTHVPTSTHTRTYVHTHTHSVPFLCLLRIGNRCALTLETRATPPVSTDSSHFHTRASFLHVLSSLLPHGHSLWMKQGPMFPSLAKKNFFGCWSPFFFFLFSLSPPRCLQLPHRCCRGLEYVRFAWGSCTFCAPIDTALGGAW